GPSNQHKFVFFTSNVFCISLKNQEFNRWQRMLKRSNHFQLPISKYDACTFNLNTEVTNTMNTLNAPRSVHSIQCTDSSQPITSSHTITDVFTPGMKPGELGCAQSHINLWRRIIQQNLPYALILEDDVQFRTDWLEQLSICSVPQDDPEWHGLFLNIMGSMPPPYHTWARIGPQCCTGAYILSARGAQWLLANFGKESNFTGTTTGSNHEDEHRTENSTANSTESSIESSIELLYPFTVADWMTMEMHKQGHSYSMFPWLVKQEYQDSTIRPIPEMLGNLYYSNTLLRDAEYSFTNYI
ncbi:MAG: hypothetical protein Sylvanvirus30_11, partial [Sylvanvirus sp.]